MSLEDMDDLAELTDYCKAQYANCMDNYCNVLDDNQGRCSCSANIKNYAKAEQALKTATEELQDVAQKIQYIGLTTREVETLFTETIAEETMRTKGTDNSQLQASLNKIKDMIIDVKSGTATSSASNDILGLNFDLSGLLEFSFDSTGFDLGSLFGTTNTNSVSNQRGEELYKTAAARCKSSVLKACTARGVDASLVTNAYDLEIDRECMAYERSLNDSNDQMLATVRNAKNVLQKARLMVAQQKNAYDMRGCINALDACMQDEFVCGSDYENCLDPTGRYIVNGEIVVGSQPGHAIDPEISQRVSSVMTSDVCRVNLYRTWDMVPGTCEEHTPDNYIGYPTTNQGNAWGSGTEDTLSKYIEKTVTGNYPAKTSENMSLYLQNKIGYNQKDRNYGMCMSVLNKCQDYTYTRGTGTSAQYEPANQVVQQYLARVLVQIKAKQDEILANYAETCVSDVTSCLGQNGYPTEDPSEWEESERSTNTTKMNIAVNACRAQIVTCMSVNGYSIDTPTPTEMNCWVQGLLYSTSTGECMQNNVHPDACQDGTTWCQYTKSCELPENCQQQEYSVTINCNDAILATTSPQTTDNKKLRLQTWWCVKSGDYTLDGWACNSNNKTHEANAIYSPSSNNTTCKAMWKYTGTPQEHYTVHINCGSYGSNYGVFQGTPDTFPSLDCEDEQCGTIQSNGNSATLSSSLCSINNSGVTINNWNCGSSGTVPVNGQLTNITTNNITCTAQWSAGGPTPTNYSVNLTCGTGTTGGSGYHNNNVQSGASVPLSGLCQCSGGISSKLSWDGVCRGETRITVNNDIDCTATCSANPTPGDECNESNPTQCTSQKTCDAATGIWVCPDDNESESECVCKRQGGTRRVQIDDGSYGTRANLSKGNAWQLDTVWVDTDGSKCQEKGVYIADPNDNMLVCTDKVTSIGWWKSPDKRSPGFYIEGKDILFAHEWGDIVEESFTELAKTSPKETLVAKPKVYGDDVGYVSFNKSDKNWDVVYSAKLVDKNDYLHNKFNIDFYPNRPNNIGTTLPLSYTYIEGDGYYKQLGTNEVVAYNTPNYEADGYTFRGFYPGRLSEVSADSPAIGRVWPDGKGGQPGARLSNTSWVLWTDDSDFQTLNLYAAWAKNCPKSLPTGMKKCELTIGKDGSVTYAVECQDGYEMQGAGADAKCIVPGSNWRSIEFVGATADY